MCMGVEMCGCVDVGVISRRPSADWRERQVGRGHRIVSANRADEQACLPGARARGGQVGVRWRRLP